MSVTLVQHGDYTSGWDERFKRFFIKLRREKPLDVWVGACASNNYTAEKLQVENYRVDVNMEKQTVDGTEDSIHAITDYLMQGKPQVMDSTQLLWFTSQIDFGCQEFFRGPNGIVWRVLCEGCGLYARTFFAMIYAADYIREPSCKCKSTMHIFEVSNRQDSRFVAAVETGGDEDEEPDIHLTR